VFLCAATTVPASGPTAFSGNAGLASLGLVCAAGIAVTYVTSGGGTACLVGVVGSGAQPHVASRSAGVAPTGPEDLPAPSPDAPRPSSGPRVWTPSSFYRAGLMASWPDDGTDFAGRPGQCFVAAAGELHFRWRRARRDVVVRNLLPVCGGDRMVGEQTARQLYRNFAVKLADLWRVESGLPVRDWITAPGDLERIRDACHRGRACSSSPFTWQLGTWRHLVGQLGLKLTVLTLAEPDDRLTHIRLAARKRWGIETLLIARTVLRWWK